MLEKTSQEKHLDNTDFVAWRVMQAKKKQHASTIKRCYNMRARLRRETKH